MPDTPLLPYWDPPSSILQTNFTSFQALHSTEVNDTTVKMATEGSRRSTRVRTQVKTYAEEQADNVVKAAAPKRKRKSDTADEEVESKKPAKKTKEAPKPNGPDDSVAVSAPAKKAKPSRTATNRSWHGDAAERRIAVNNRNIRRLVPGQEETRERE